MAMNAVDEEQQAKIIDGKSIAKTIRAEIKAETEALGKSGGIVPGLAVVLVGQRPDSATYVRMKKKAAKEVGFYSVDISLEENVTQEELEATISQLNEDAKVHGILVQLPLPEHISEAEVLKKIAVEKDVDGFSVTNIGNLCLRGGDPPLAIACTPAGCMELLRRSNVEVSGKDAVVLGRSNIVGMPIANLLQQSNATVTVCHSRTQNVEEHIRRADILIAAIGKPHFVQGSWIKPGATIIDVGINSVPDASRKRGYRLVGDVDFAAAVSVAGKITPVPGGVGPMTIAMLLKNTLELAKRCIDQNKS